MASSSNNEANDFGGNIEEADWPVVVGIEAVALLVEDAELRFVEVIWIRVTSPE